MADETISEILFFMFFLSGSLFLFFSVTCGKKVNFAAENVKWLHVNVV